MSEDAAVGETPERAAERRRDPGPTGEEFEDLKRQSRVRSIAGFTLLALAFAIAVLSFIVAIRLASITDDLRDSAVETCEVGRRGQVFSIRRDVERLQATDPALFPDIPPAKFEKLRVERLEDYANQARRLDPDRCERKFPE